MSSPEFLAGWDAYRQMQPEPEADAHREFRRGYQRALLVGEEGPLGPFRIVRLMHMEGQAMLPIEIGSVLATSQPEAIFIAREVWPHWSRARLQANRK